MTEVVSRDQREFIYRLSLGLARSKIDELDGSVNGFIAELGEWLCSDRAYLISLEEATQTISITHEACKKGVTPQREAIQNVPMARFPWLMDQLQALPVLVIPEVEELSSDAEEEKLEFQREGIRSLVLVDKLPELLLADLKNDGEEKPSTATDVPSKTITAKALRVTMVSKVMMQGAFC